MSRFPRPLLLLVALLAVLASVSAGPAVAASSTIEELEPVRHGFDLLMDHFVRPPDSALLLQAAWQGAAEEARRAGEAQPDIPPPLLTGARQGDWSAFEGQWATVQGRLVGRLEPGRLAQAALRAMARALDEGHTLYLEPERYEEHLAWSRGELRYGGIGVRVAGQQAVIVEVFEDSPAERAGLRPGDEITHVDGWPVAGGPLGEALGRVRGQQGTEVELTIRRPGREGSLEWRIVRGQIEVSAVRSRMLPGPVGYLQVRSFPESSVVEQVREAVAALRHQGALGLVLDLRGNSGGRLDVGTRMLNMFVADGPLYQETARDGSRLTVPARPSRERFDLPLVVLVDAATASMGELFASAIQERGIGWVVGQTTSGNVAAAQIFPLDDGSALQITVAEILSGRGERLNGLGVTPDLQVENDLEALAWEVDAQLEAAAELLTRSHVAPPPSQQQLDRAA